jgi:hypothetical protein
MYTESAPKSILEWTHLLSISTTFKFSRLRELAIQELGTNYNLHPVEKIVFSKAYDVPDWFQPAFEELLHRKMGPRRWEAEKLGSETAVSIYMAREDLRHGPNKTVTDGLKPSKSTLPNGLLSSPFSLQESDSTEMSGGVARAEQHTVEQKDLQGVTESEEASAPSGDDSEDTTSADDIQGYGSSAPLTFTPPIAV